MGAFAIISTQFDGNYPEKCVKTEIGNVPTYAQSIGQMCT